MAEPLEKRARKDLTTDSFRVVFPGEDGGFAHIAVTQFLSNSPKAEICGVRTFSDAFQEVMSGKALYACVPIENSSSGIVSQTYDLLAAHDVVIGGELGVRESYCLCGKEGTQLADVKLVLSAANIIEACSEFIEKKLPASTHVLATPSSAEGARRVAKEEKAGSVAIGARESAMRNGLKILASNIGNHKVLEARYILLHRRVGPAAELTPPFPRGVVSPVRKLTAVFAVKDEPGGIYKLLACWAMRGINLSRVEARPVKAGQDLAGAPAGNIWDFLVFADWSEPPGHSQEASHRLWEALTEFSQWQRHFGTYPSQTSREVKKQLQSWDDMIDLMTKA